MLKRLFYPLAGLALSVTVLLCFALDDSPSPQVQQSLNRDDIQRAKQLLNVSSEERDSVKTVKLNQKDLNIAVSYLLNHFVENTTQIQLLNDRLQAQIAIFVPQNPWGRYLDISFSLRQAEHGIRIKSFKIGEISIPDPAANILIPAIATYPPLKKYWLVASQYVQNVRITPNALEVSYLGSVVESAKQLAIQKHREYPNLHRYQQQINAIVSQHDPAWRLSLIDLLQPLFEFAYRNTEETDAIRENRAIIIAVGSYIYKSELRRFLPIGLVYNKELPVYAYKRVDIPQHFIASALLAAVDAKLLGEQLGVDKELGDAEKGSGFSFIDLSADRAGARFGTIAISTTQRARELQKTLSQIKDYSEIIPDVQDLPEHMDAQTFQIQYQKVGSPKYAATVAEIDRRIAKLPLYRND